MQIDYTEIVKFFKNLYTSDYDNRVIYFFVFGGEKLSKIGLQISRMRETVLFGKLKCEHFIC